MKIYLEKCFIDGRLADLYQIPTDTLSFDSKSQMYIQTIDDKAVQAFKRDEILVIDLGLAAVVKEG